MEIQVSIDINDKIFLRNPLETALGKNILSHAILLMDEIGLENFNFKKLAFEMNSTEASIYRYFENKYMLLAYLMAWYWEYLNFIIELNISNRSDAKEKLNIIVDTIINLQGKKIVPEYIDIDKLQQLVAENAQKLYHIKEVDDLNKEGFFLSLKKLVNTISQEIKSVNPKFKYPRALATNILEFSMNNEYYMTHLPKLSDFNGKKSIDTKKETTSLINYYLDKLLS